jgi:hypothetical protein
MTIELEHSFPRQPSSLFLFISLASKEHTNLDLENTIHHTRINLVQIHTCRQSDSALKAPHDSLSNVDHFTLYFLVHGALSRDDEDVVLDSHVDLILLGAGEIDTDAQLTWGLEDVHRDHVALGGVRVERAAGSIAKGSSLVRRERGFPRMKDILVCFGFDFASVRFFQKLRNASPL